MTDWGTVELANIETILNVKLVASFAFSNGVQINPSQPVTLFDLDPKRNAIPPVSGQIWPRGVIGNYYGNTGGLAGPGTLGYATIFNLDPYIIKPWNTKGQLWPRGDYVPSDPHR